MELIDLISNIYQIQLLYLSFVLLIGRILVRLLARHLIYRDPLDIKSFVLDLLSKPVLIDVDISKFGIKFGVSYLRSRIVYILSHSRVKSRSKLKPIALKKTLPPDNFNSSSR